jgi:hypothetical protein
VRCVSANSSATGKLRGPIHCVKNPSQERSLEQKRVQVLLRERLVLDLGPG